MPISTVWILKYVQQCYVKWFWTISSLGAPVFWNSWKELRHVHTIPDIFSLRREKLSSVVWTPGRINLYPPWWTLDCEWSLFFFRFSESNARARERRSRKTRETRAISRLAPSVTRVAICVSRVLLDGLQKKEGLLVVYVNTYPICDSLEIGCAVTEIAPPQTFLFVNRSPNRYGFRGDAKVWT